MSENENQPPVPNKQTSSVPLKKETVRVTLKAADAPPAVPSATVPMAPPVRPPVPGGAPPTPTVSPMAPPRPTAPAPTIALRTAGPAGPAAPAPTIRLATSPGTAPLRPGGSPTLPKATVQLQVPTQPLGTAFPAAPSQAQLLEEEEVEEVEPHAGLYKILTGVGLFAAIALFFFQLMTTMVWIKYNAEGNENTPAGPDWSRLIE